MNTFEAVSVIISSLLDIMGYGSDMIQYRREFCKMLGQFYSNEDFYIIIAGSRGEGISKQFESDRDLISVLRHVICREFQSTSQNGCSMTIFQLEREQCSPGYALLKLQRNNRVRPPAAVNESLLKLGEDLYLPSACWKYDGLQRIAEGLNEHETNIFFLSTLRDCRGPSIPSSSEITNIKEDNVAALECECLTVFLDYEARRRYFDWPSFELRAAVEGTKIHVVPTGMDDSPFQLLEWRICCTEAEMLLIQGLNPCYVKALILLKWIMKQILKPICKEMTSYVAKNIILWLAEITDSTRVSDSKLVGVLRAALKLLKTCIWRNRLPSYMIPKRDIFAGRLTRRSPLCARIDLLLREGPRAILRCPTITHLLQMMYHVPETLRQDLLQLRKMEIGTVEGFKLLARDFTVQEFRSLSAQEILLRLLSNNELILLWQWMAHTDEEELELTSGQELAAFSEEDIEETVNIIPYWCDIISRDCPLLFGI